MPQDAIHPQRAGPVPAADRLIFALDVAGPDEALGLARKLGDAVTFYKAGLELFLSGRPYLELTRELAGMGKKVMADLKLFDVPATVARAVARLEGSGATYVTVHGNDAIMEAAVGVGGETKVLAVTVLTSLDRGDLEDLGFTVDVESLVLSRARRALALGCAGVVSSGLEVRALRESTGAGLVAVVPGIRPVEGRGGDDQKRTMTLEEAFAAGADHVVVGRPIRDAPDPAEAAREMQRRIARIFGEGE